MTVTANKFKMPELMGIINVTPDSFSDGGACNTVETALRRAGELLRDGAAILDIGGESTRPGAMRIPDLEEIRRVVPVIRAIRETYPVCRISVDTRKAAVAAAALEAGADMVNDVSGLTFDPALASAAAAADAELVIGHTRGTPEVMRDPENCRYADVVEEIAAFWRCAAEQAVSAGVAREKLIFDPCPGFSKSAEQDWEMIRRMEEWRSFGRLLIGHSRKSFLGTLPGLENPADRDAATGAVSLYAAAHGASILRVHNVKMSAQILMVWQKLLR